MTGEIVINGEVVATVGTASPGAFRPTLEPKALRGLREVMRVRRKHRERARLALAAYLAAPCPRALIRLMRAQEASRGSRIRARRVHETWESAQRVMRDVLGMRER